MNPTIGIIGSGNVAWHVGHALKKAGYPIKYVVGRNKQAVTTLAAQLNANAHTLTQKCSADIVILALSDSAITGYLEKQKPGCALLLHCAGTLSIEILKPYAKQYGVLYPFQTLTKEVKTDFSEVPLCIEANDSETKEEILKFANAISNNIQFLNSEQRKILHLTGVVANNFSNYLYSIAYNLLIDNNLNPHLLEPLILETATKLINNHPDDMQTGPARRNNNNVINEHINLLEKYPEIQQLYSLISEQIIKKFN